MTTLRILHRNYVDFASALEEEARLFEGLHPGTVVELTSVGIRELHEKALRDGGLREGRYDLALLVTDWLAEGQAGGSFEDLNRWQQRIPIPDWPAGWARSLARPVVVGDVWTSLPWHDGPECLVYRSDLFSNPGRQAAFRAQFGRQLGPPTTWEEF